MVNETEDQVLDTAKTCIDLAIKTIEQVFATTPEKTMEYLNACASQSDIKDFLEQMNVYRDEIKNPTENKSFSQALNMIEVLHSFAFPERDTMQILLEVSLSDEQLEAISILAKNKIKDSLSTSNAVLKPASPAHVRISQQDKHYQHPDHWGRRGDGKQERQLVDARLGK